MLTRVREIEFLYFKQNENTESSFRMSEFVAQSTNINSGVDNSDCHVEVNHSSSFTSKVNCGFLQMQQILSLAENLPYLYKIVLNENSKIELK